MFLLRLEKDKSEERVKNHFPFNEFFSDAPGWPLILGNDAAEDWRVADGCYTHIKNVFKFLEECRAFELLRNSYVHFHRRVVVTAPRPRPLRPQLLRPQPLGHQQRPTMAMLSPNAS